MVLVALVLLMMCGNLASLLIARSLRRKKEVAVRLAIGAGIGRLLRQALTETLLLALLGGAASLLLESSLTRSLLLFLPPTESGFLTFHFDVRMLGFAAAITLGAALLFGLLPAFQSVGVPLNAVMSEGGRVSGAGRRPRLTKAVIAIQVSVSLALVIGSLLNARSLKKLSDTNLGFQTANVHLLDVNPGRAGIRGAQSDLLYRHLVDELNETPGIMAASQSRIVPVSGSQWWDSAVVPGYTPLRDEATTIYHNQVTPEYFKTMGIPIVEGRAFTGADDKMSRKVAIVNESFARHFFQGRSAIGRVVSFSGGLARPHDERFAMYRNLEIVGVAANTKYTEPREAQKEQVYLSSYQSGVDLAGSVEIRLTPGMNPTRAEAQIRGIVMRLSGGLDVQFRPFDAVYARSLQRDRMVAVLSGIFGLLGLIMVSVGLYGVMSQSVAARAGEIGIRMALGAHASAVQGMVLREALLLVGAGVLMGLPLAIAFARLMGDLLYGVSPSDPDVLLGAAGLMALVGAASAWAPAVRASRIDPIVTLRNA